MTAMTSPKAALMVASIRAIALTIREAFTTQDSRTWAELVEAIKAHHIIAPGGWLVPRSALQTLINEGFIRRQPDVHSEVYEKVK